MAVAFDAVATDVYGSLVTSISTTMTVGAGSFRVLVASLAWSANVSNVSVWWDYTGTQTLIPTLIKSDSSTVSARADLWGLVNPVSGTSLTLKAAWTTSPGDAYICGSSWTGADQNDGASTFPHPTSGKGSATPTLTVTSAANEQTVVVAACNTNFSVPTQTQIYLDNTGGTAASASTRAAGAATVTHAWTATGAWVTVGTDIAVITHPAITTQPVTQTVVEGQQATFTVAATASSGALSYQWTQNGANVGTNSSTYTTAATTNADNLSTVNVVVTDSNGSTTSATVYLIVIPAASEWLWNA